MNVFLYLRHFPPRGAPLVGGTEKAVHGFAAGLAASGANVTVLCTGPNDSVVVANSGYAIRCFARPASRRPFAISREMKHYLATETEGVVVLNGLFTPSVFSVARTLWRARKPYVFAPHGVYQPELFRRNTHLKLPYWTLFERRVLGNATAIQVQDGRQEHWLRTRGVRTPVIVVPSGVFADDVPSNIASRWRSEGGPAFLFFGRIDVYGKGLDLLLEAFAHVAEPVDARLTIQGPISGRQPSIRELAVKLGVADRVTLLGPDYDTPGPIRMADYDVVCIPSRWESYSVSGLEAMMAARVILISNVAGLAPHVAAAECGALVSPDVPTMTTGLRELLGRRAHWREMGWCGRQYALDNLQWRQIGSAALEHYRRLVPDATATRRNASHAT